MKRTIAFILSAALLIGFAASSLAAPAVHSGAAVGARSPFGSGGHHTGGAGHWNGGHWGGHRHHHHYGSNIFLGVGFGYPFGYGYYGDPFYGYGYYPYGYAPYGFDYYRRGVVRGEMVAGRGSGDVVARVQQRLARSGYYQGAIDGVVGRGTRRAIRAFERSHGLPADGEIDNALLARLGVA